MNGLLHVPTYIDAKLPKKLQHFLKIHKILLKQLLHDNKIKPFGRFNRTLTPEIKVDNLSEK